MRAVVVPARQRLKIALKSIVLFQENVNVSVPVQMRSLLAKDPGIIGMKHCVHAYVDQGKSNCHIVPLDTRSIQALLHVLVYP